LIDSAGLAIDTGRTQNIAYDYDRVIAVLARFAEKGYSYNEVNGSDLTDEGLTTLRSDAWGAFMQPNQKKGRKLPKNAFGTNAYPWQDFGTGIPALFLYDDDERCIDVYPHEENQHLITITEYLDALE
jgi:hypothetical protein